MSKALQRSLREVYHSERFKITIIDHLSYLSCEYTRVAQWKSIGFLIRWPGVRISPWVPGADV